MRCWSTTAGVRLQMTPRKRAIPPQQNQVKWRLCVFLAVPHAAHNTCSSLLLYFLHACTGQALALQRRFDKFQKQFPKPDRFPRKLVFNYNDAYAFSRVIMNDDLVFDSHFESGNLQQAYRVRPANGTSPSMEYELILYPDPSKKAHVQW